MTTWSPSASLQIKSLATKYTTVKWPITFYFAERVKLTIIKQTQKGKKWRTDGVIFLLNWRKGDDWWTVGSCDTLRLFSNLCFAARIVVHVTLHIRSKTCLNKLPPGGLQSLICNQRAEFEKCEGDENTKRLMKRSEVTEKIHSKYVGCFIL